MIWRWKQAWAAALAVLAIAGCQGKEAPKTPMRPEPSPERLKAAAPFVQASNDFGLKLMGMVAKGRDKPNLLLSPISLQLCSSLLLESAKGAERDEMKKALGLGAVSDENLGDFVKASTDALLSDPERPLQLANAVWLTIPIDVEKSFADRVAQRYDGEIGSSNGAEEAKSAINTWVNQKTHGMIPKLLESVNPLEYTMMLNAVAFEARWKHEFKQERTRTGAFMTSSGKSVQVPFMSETFIAFEAREEHYTGVRMDYLGGAYSMIALLPPEHKTPMDVLETIQSQGFPRFLDTFHGSEVFVTFPKFSWKDGCSLKEAFKSLGVRKAFEHLDQSPLSPKLSAVFLSRIEHKTFIEVDEKGTRAAAASAEPAAAAVPSPLTFDRPFLYAIVHNKTGAILFLGICGDPTQSS